MKWRCVEDIFSYCKSEPDWEKEPIWMKDSNNEPTYPLYGTCKLNPQTCKKHQTFKESTKKGG